MFGGSNGYGAAGTMAIPNASLPSNTGVGRRQNAGGLGMLTGGASAWALVVLLALYVVWAMVQQHQKLRDQVKPSNLALNFHNLIATALTVVVSLGLVKLLLAVANKYNIPGAQAVANVVDFSA